MLFFIIFETFSCFLLFLLLTFLGYIAILITVKVFWLSILEIVVGLSNVHRLSSFSICYFYSLSVFSATIGRYPNIILIMLGHTFFFNKKMVYSLSMSVFMAKTSNLIIKSVVFCFHCLKDSIFYSASAVFILLLNIILISLINTS